MSDNLTLREAIPRILEHLKAYQYSTEYMSTFRRHLNAVVDCYNDTGNIYYEPDLYVQFLSSIEKKFTTGNLSPDLFWSYRKCAYFLDAYFSSGVIKPKMLFRKMKKELIDNFNEPLEVYLSTLKSVIRNSTIKQRRYAIHQYLCFLQDVGCKSLDSITVNTIQQYFTEQSTSVSKRTLNQNRLHIRQFHMFLFETNRFAPNCLSFFDFKVTVPSKIQGYLSSEEIDSILSEIDVETNIGKRDYAIVCLARTTGLRGIDVINLKLTDIDWKSGVISVCQRKTAVLLQLPLLAEAGEAIKDYILNGRPLTKAQEIFVRAQAPHTAFHSTSSLDAILRKYQKKANLENMSWDGKAFHGTRRSLGRSLVLAEVPVSDIIQILGQTHLDSGKPYMMLNTPELKGCALDFTNIPLKRGELL